MLMIHGTVLCVLFSVTFNGTDCTGLGLESLDWTDSSPLNVSSIWHMIINTQCTYHMIYWYACIVSDACSGYDG